jgi:hypothetical protein
VPAASELSDGEPLTIARASDPRAWDEFVQVHPEARFCHLWHYRDVLENVFRYRCVYLEIRAGASLVGIFPSIAVTHGKPRLISQPFNEYGGPLLLDLTRGQIEQIPALLLAEAERAGCQSIEIRGGPGMPVLSSPYCTQHVLHQYAELALQEPDWMWRHSLTNEARKGVNKARKANLRVEIRTGDAAVADPFYRLHLISMKRLGVPPHSRNFFTQLARAFGERLLGAWVFQDDQVVAILLALVSGARVQLYITVSTPESWPHRPNDLAHWEMICWAQRTGCACSTSARRATRRRFSSKKSGASRCWTTDTT